MNSSLWEKNVNEIHLRGAVLAFFKNHFAAAVQQVYSCKQSCTVLLLILWKAGAMTLQVRRVSAVFWNSRFLYSRELRLLHTLGIKLPGGVTVGQCCKVLNTTKKTSQIVNEHTRKHQHPPIISQATDNKGQLLHHHPHWDFTKTTRCIILNLSAIHDFIFISYFFGCLFFLHLKTQSYGAVYYRKAGQLLSLQNE